MAFSMALVMRTESCDEVKIKAESSEYGTISACITWDGKLFICEVSTTSIRYNLPSRESWLGVGSAQARNYFFTTIILVIILV